MSTTWVGTVVTPTIEAYVDSVGTFARPASSRVTDRAEQGRLAEEQAALRRVATLVARGAPSSEVFEAVAQEVAQVLGLLNAARCSLLAPLCARRIFRCWNSVQ